MASAVDLRRGMAVKMDGDLYVVLTHQHVTPGNWRAYVQASLRSIKTGKIFEKRFRSTESVDVVTMDPKNMTFSYKDNEGYHFMDTEDYNTYTLSEAVVGDAKNFLKENIEANVLFYEGNAIEIDLPASVILKVAETIPGVRGNSATNVQKPATLETGYKIDVPLFIDEGEEIKVDTRTGAYLGRA